MQQYFLNDGEIGKTCSCQRRYGEDVVKDNLVLTPAKVAEITSKGSSVSLSTGMDFYDGDTNPSFDVPLERTRGVDPATLWNAGQDVKRKFYKAHKNDVDIYGW